MFCLAHDVTLNVLTGITWPAGTYGLQMPMPGCPRGSGFQWHTGTRFHDTEDRRPNNHWSSPYDLAGTVGRNNMEQRFCIKTSLKGRRPWPKGEYCILKKGNCPAGLFIVVFTHVITVSKSGIIKMNINVFWQYITPPTPPPRLQQMVNYHHLLNSFLLHRFQLGIYLLG